MVLPQSNALPIKTILIYYNMSKIQLFLLYCHGQPLFPEAASAHLPQELMALRNEAADPG